MLVAVTEGSVDLPSSLSDGTPIVVINIHEPADGVGPGWIEQYPKPEPDGKYITHCTLRAHYDRFRKFHINVRNATVVAFRGSWRIVMGVIGKGLVPCGQSLLPKQIDGVPVHVAEYGLIPLGRQALGSREPQPQVGGAFAPLSRPGRMGTIGPAVTLADGRRGFFTAAHVFRGCGIREPVIVPGPVAIARSALQDTSISAKVTDQLISQRGVQGAKDHASAFEAQRAGDPVSDLPAFKHRPDQKDDMVVGELGYVNFKRDVALVLMYKDQLLSTHALN